MADEKLQMLLREVRETKGAWRYDDAVLRKLDAHLKRLGAERCKFIIAWVGHCEHLQVPGSVVCAEHIDKKCWACKEQATEECPETLGLVCGMPHCEKHPHRH